MTKRAGSGSVTKCHGSTTLLLSPDTIKPSLLNKNKKKKNKKIFFVCKELSKLLLFLNCEAMFAYSSQAMTFRMPGEGRHSPVNESCQAEKNQKSKVPLQ
jgi:hypothetical protein